MGPKEQHCQQEYKRVTSETKQGVIHPHIEKPHESCTSENAYWDLLVSPEYNISH